ncbi:MAG: deoxyguanosinetriphosphate triphosphohydrolase [Clostridia bacterium]|nr:deoxyguanosinetriphosphate triphosphohydrolase [Clostridia bacterium]
MISGEQSIRKMLEERERLTLSQYAFLSENTQGRLYPLNFDDTRTEFQRDRDRIIHSKSFRRLMHKTQVFLSPEHDHYRTRLTHTLEVTQIARTICRSLRLNEDLAEAIGLGHDLGHTPFGHAGERVIQRCYSPDFTHSKQSLRVADKLERLDLTYEVRDGILMHSGNDMAKTLEGRVIRFADRIAYINHDIDDALRAGILSQDMLPRDATDILGKTHGERINSMVTSLVRASTDKNDIDMEPEFLKATDELRAFLFSNVYFNSEAKSEESKAEAVVETLYTYFTQNPEKLPEEFTQTVEDEGVERAACDYISGMTDRYAIRTYSEIYVPKLWIGF